MLRAIKSSEASEQASEIYCGRKEVRRQQISRWWFQVSKKNLIFNSIVPGEVIHCDLYNICQMA